MDNTAIITTNCRTQDVPINSIKVSKRIRQNALDIDALAEDIRWNGLINPPTVLDNGDETFTLITGLRRLRACQRLEAQTIRVTILTAIEADDMLALEYAENEQRQDFTTAERLEYAEKIKEIELRRGRERMSLARRADYEKGDALTISQGVFHGTHLEAGKARDIIAKKTGFSSGVQYWRANKIAETRPDLLDKIDSGEMSIRQAYSEAFAIPAEEGQSGNEVSGGREMLPSNVIPLSRPHDAPEPEQRPTGAPCGSTAIQPELEAEAAADERAYRLTKAYTNTICAVIQLETTPQAVREWIRFSRMDRKEIEGVLMDIRVAVEHLGKLEAALSSCLGPRLIKKQ